MQTSLKYIGRRKVEGFALIVSLAMITLAAVITVALLSSASTDRFNSNAYSKRARAEMAAQSGLAAALNALVGADPSDATKTVPNDFRFVTAAGDDNKPALIPLSYDAPTGKASLNLVAKRPLYSNSGTSATLTLSSTASPKATRPAGYISITSPDPSGTNQEIERYAFYVDEGSSRQNLSVQGGSDRVYARDPNELPVVTATAAPVPFNATQITALQTNRALLFTPQTANPVLASNATTPAVDNYSYASAGAVANLTPEGKPRVDLSKLKNYVDGLAVTQTKGNPRSALVDRLLDSNESGTDWGADDGKGGKLPGGNLSFLTKTGHYSSIQAHQIIANLLDYLDADLIPTTDDVTNPTYFGVEGQADSSGKVVGHPYINFVGTGMVLNRSSASGNTGGLNSTRVLLCLGLVNPWSNPTKAWDAFYVEPEVEIVITGTANGGTLGSDAGLYFEKTFSSGSVDPSGNPEKLYPVKNIPANTGYCFPVPMSGTTNYATFKDLKGTGKNGLGQPPGMSFSNLAYQINKLRLKFTSTDGKVGYVQVLDGIKGMVQPANPSTVDCGTAGGALNFKYTNTPAKTDYHLASDPRISFRSPTSVPATWMLLKSTENGSNPPTPASAVAIFNGSDNGNWDFTAKSPSVSDQTWYTKTDITSDFYVKSPTVEPRDPTDKSPKLDSAGEIGFLHTGIPWETLRMYVSGGESGGKERDKELLAYVQSGTFTSADYGTVPTHAGQTAPTNPVPLLGGPLNVNTNKKPTLASLFLGAAEVTDSNATANAKSGTDSKASNLTDAVAANAATAPFTLPSDLLTLPAAKTITDGQTNDFDREVLARRTTNVTGTQSTRFTVYVLGEARDKLGTARSTSSTVNLRAEVELQTDSTGRPIPKVLSTAYYLTN